ncbi:hypothetical protein LTR95_007034 [Oleoguttula sp. CCFEE 5521]
MMVQLEGVIASQIYRTDDKPLYHRGNSVLIAIACLAIALFVFAKFYYVLKKKTRARKWDAISPEQKQDYLDTTKHQGNKRLDFRFAHREGNKVVCPWRYRRVRLSELYTFRMFPPSVFKPDKDATISLDTSQPRPDKILSAIEHALTAYCHHIDRATLLVHYDVEDNISLPLADVAN